MLKLCFCFCLVNLHNLVKLPWMGDFTISHFHICLYYIVQTIYGQCTFIFLQSLLLLCPGTGFLCRFLYISFVYSNFLFLTRSALHMHTYMNKPYMICSFTDGLRRSEMYNSRIDPNDKYGSANLLT